MRAYLNKIHVTIMILSVVLAVAALVLSIVFAATSDGQIPVHFGLDGKADEYASAWEAISLPIILLVTNLTMVVMLLFVPLSAWNIPVKITENNAPILYREAALLVSLIGLLFSLMSLVGTICLYKAHEAAGYVTIGFTVLNVVIAIVFTVKMVVDGKRYA